MVRVDFSAVIEVEVTEIVFLGLDTGDTEFGSHWRMDLTDEELVGFTSFGCGDCPVPVFSERFGYGWQLEAGLDLMMSEETGFGLDLVVPRFGIGAAVPGNLRLSSPLAVVRVSVLGRFSP